MTCTFCNCPDSSLEFMSIDHTVVLLPGLSDTSDQVAAQKAALEDVAPTMIGLLGLEKPDEMTGKDLRGE